MADISKKQDYNKLKNRTNNVKTTSDALKAIALISMFIDHAGYFIFPGITILRTLGRIAFPIFCYYLAVGYDRTSNRKKYAFRLLKFALITQIPYYFFLYSYDTKEFLFNPMRFNVMFLLLAGVGVIYLYNKFLDAKVKLQKCKCFSSFTKMFLAGATFLFAVFLPEFLKILVGQIELAGFGFARLKFSYGTYGLILIVIFYIFKDRPFKGILAFVVISIIQARIISTSASVFYIDGIGGFERLGLYLKQFFTTPYSKSYFTKLLALSNGMHDPYFQSRAIMGVLLVYSMKDMRGNFRLPRGFAYWFYPIHVAILGTISIFVSS